MSAGSDTEVLNSRDWQRRIKNASWAVKMPASNVYFMSVATILDRALNEPS